MRRRFSNNLVPDEVIRKPNLRIDITPSSPKSRNEAIVEFQDDVRRMRSDGLDVWEWFWELDLMSFMASYQSMWVDDDLSFCTFLHGIRWLNVLSHKFHVQIKEDFHLVQAHE